MSMYVWPCLCMYDRVYVCMTMSMYVWPCLCMYDHAYSAVTRLWPTLRTTNVNVPPLTVYMQLGYHNCALLCLTMSYEMENDLTHTHTHTHTNTRTFTHTLTHSHKHTHTHIHKHSHTHTYTHTFIQCFYILNSMLPTNALSVHFPRRQIWAPESP